MDTKNFFGNVLHVFYAPELETLAETRIKLITRRKEVSQRINKLQTEKGNKEALYKRNDEIPQEENSVEQNSCCSIPQSTPISSLDQLPCTSNLEHIIPTILQQAQNVRSTHNPYLPGSSASDPSTGTTYALTNANQGESIANFYKVYNTQVTTTQESPIGPVLPQNTIQHEKEFHELANSNPYKTNAPFMKDKSSYITGADKELNSNKSLKKRKYTGTKVDVPSKMRNTYTTEDRRNSNCSIDTTTSTSIPPIRQLTNDMERLDNNSKNLNPKSSFSSTAEDSSFRQSSSSQTNNFKFKFIPRQVISKKKS